MHIADQAADRHRLLVHIVRCAPDIALFDRLKILKYTTFVQKFLHRLHPAVDGTVIYDEIRILRFVVEVLDLHTDRRPIRIRISDILKYILATCKLDHLRDIILARTHLDQPIGRHIEERYRLVGSLDRCHLIDLTYLFVKHFLCLLFLTDERTEEFHPLHSCERMLLIAGILNHCRDVKIRKHLTDFRRMCDHGILDCQRTIFRNN